MNTTISRLRAPGYVVGGLGALAVRTGLLAQAAATPFPINPIADDHGDDDADADQTVRSDDRLVDRIDCEFEGWPD